MSGVTVNRATMDELTNWGWKDNHSSVVQMALSQRPQSSEIPTKTLMQIKSQIERSLLLKQALINVNKEMNRTIGSPKVLQLSVIKEASKNHVIACLPTGFGKSLIYQMLACMHSDKFVIVASPLNAIINEQCTKMPNVTVNAKNLDVNDKPPNIVIGHPEDLLSDKSKAYFKKYSHMISHIVIDEAHCLLQWGSEFRPKFAELSSLRALCPKANILALTATASPEDRKKIAEKLALNVRLKWLI